jgi:hypothetical protein
MLEDTRDEEQTELAWNPGGVGNAAGADLATPSSTWNPGGTGNADEFDEDAETDENTPEPVPDPV